ncbi:MAG: NAD(P)-dependent oxidoreductase [Nanoarchaeota archaeon]|nr:NAD(P)-dependent oxidoreductase [Nanoarchaeota archaeon]
MKIAVTGANGYIGSRLIQKLKDKHQIIPLVRIPKGDENERVTDITDFDSINQALREVDYVIHLAAISKPRTCEENKEKAYDVNVLGTRNVLEACKKNRVKGVLFASTIYVYGKSTEIKNEGDEPNPDNHYAETKWLAEKICEGYRSHFPVTILRFSFIYGPSQEGTVVSDFIQKIKNNPELRMMSSKEQRIGLLHIDDALKAIEKSLETKANTTLNISPKKIVTLEELAQTIMDVLDKEIPIKDVPSKKAPRLASPEKARKILGWKAETRLEQGIKEII